MSIDTLNDSNFDSETNSGVTLVDFYADWCGPCKRMLPIVNSVAETLGDSVRVVKVNIDQSPMLSQRFGIKSIPTFALVKDGQVVSKLIGSKPESELLAFVSSN